MASGAERAAVVLPFIVLALGIAELLYFKIFPWNVVFSVIIFVMAAFMVRREFFAGGESEESLGAARRGFGEEEYSIPSKKLQGPSAELERFYSRGPKGFQRSQRGATASKSIPGELEEDAKLEAEKSRLFGQIRDLIRKKSEKP